MFLIRTLKNILHSIISITTKRNIFSIYDISSLKLKQWQSFVLASLWNFFVKIQQDSLFVSLFQPFVLFSFSILIACSYCLVPSFNNPAETTQSGMKKLAIHASKLCAQYPQVWSAYDNRLIELFTNVVGLGTMADNCPAKLLVISVFTWAGSINWTMTPLEFSTKESKNYIQYLFKCAIVLW